ncbi:MAG: protein kinase, partial [Candidatus Aminicenantales bacterium]
MKCPKCHFENPADTIYCGKCGTRLPSSEEISNSQTKTIQTPLKELTRGTIFAGRYEVIEELGKGGMGRVYRVEDKKIKEEIALKLIKPEIALDKKTIERFSNELKMARKISHRNVCRMYGLDEEKGTHYITMEYVPGEDLKSFIRRSRQLTLGTALSIAKQVCEGLAEAHRLGVIHRDLKPQNIMIDREGNVRIMDFGIARSLKEKGITGAGVMIGTPEYMSPEQVEGKEVDQRSDIYSLGVILYEMVTGWLPFEGDTPFTIGMKHKSEKPPDPRELNAQVPMDLSRLILKCMEKDKEKRYQSAEEVLFELINIERGMPTTEREIPERKPLTSREITVKFTVKKMFVPGMIFLAAIIIGLVLWQLLLHKEKVKPSLAVLSFENQTEDKTYDYLREVIPNLLITNLEQSGNLQIMTRERMNDLLKQMGRKEVKNIDKDLGFDLARLDGIDAIALGSFTRAGNIFATDVKILDVKTKKLLKSVNSKGEGVGSILKNQIDELSKEISRGVGIPKGRIEASKMRIADVTTDSLEAYDFFLRGREDYEKFYFDESRRFLEKAVEIDSTFASAYLYLAWVSNALGEARAEKEAYEKAKAFSTKATDKERLYIEASYARAIEKDPEKRFRLLKQLAEKYPKEKRVHYDLASYYRRKKMFQKALEEFDIALKLDPSYGYAINDLGYLYSDMGNYEKAIEYFKRYAALSPEDANPLDSMAELYFRMG